MQANPFSNALIKIFGDQKIAIHAEDQTIGLSLIMSGGKVERVRVTRNEPPKTAADVYTDAKTLREIESVDDLKRVWFEERISVKWRNPLANLIQGFVLFVAH